MGDGVLAYFGWPRAHEDEAERAVRTGLAVCDAVGRLTAPTWQLPEEKAQPQFFNPGPCFSDLIYWFEE